MRDASVAEVALLAKVVYNEPRRENCPLVIGADSTVQMLDAN